MMGSGTENFLVISALRRRSRAQLSTMGAVKRGAGLDAAHIREAGDNAGHGIVGMNFILQIHEAWVLDRDEGFKHFPHGHRALAHSDLALFVFKVGKILHVHVEQSGTCFVNCLCDIGAGANSMPDVDAASDAGIHLLHRLQYIQRRVPQLILGSVIVDRKANVVLLHELLNSGQSRKCRVTGDYN
jgi:hypothetical protein